MLILRVAVVPSERMLGEHDIYRFSGCNYYTHHSHAATFMAPRSLVGPFFGFSAFAAFRDCVASAFAAIGIARSVAALDMGPARRRPVLSPLPGTVDCAIHTAVPG